MWIRLAHEADAAVVAAHTQGMGLWARPLEGAGRHHWLCHRAPFRDDRLATLGDDRGGRRGSAPPKRSPSVDALAGQPVSSVLWASGRVRARVVVGTLRVGVTGSGG